MQPRCHLCRSDEHIARGEGDPAQWWCVDVAECNYRARLRLHVQEDEALRLLEIELYGEPLIRPEAEEPEARSVPPIRRPFCSEHSSHFCPCASPHLYHRLPKVAAAWDGPAPSPVRDELPPGAADLVRSAHRDGATPEEIAEAHNLPLPVVAAVLAENVPVQLSFDEGAA
jgi:hypothetical protein